MQNKEHLLIIEDDARVGQSLVKGLSEAGYSTTLCSDLASAESDIKRALPDLIVLDLNLPDGDGLAFLSALRGRDVSLPVLILTARDTIDDRVKGLDGGGDDYVVKPFAFPELLARIRACLRKNPRENQTRIQAGRLMVDMISRTVAYDGELLELTTREYDLLCYIATRADEIVTRDMLIRDVWHISSRATPMDNVIEVHISRLREKLAAAGAPHLIKTIRGVGYSLESGK
jgi:DNA-binding response OmpR family regulator